MLVVNPRFQRFTQMCSSLEIRPEFDGTEVSAKALLENLKWLVRATTEADAGRILDRPQGYKLAEANAGGWNSLLECWRSPASKPLLDTWIAIVRRAHGFVRGAAGGWVFSEGIENPTESELHFKEIVPQRIRNRIAEFVRHRPLSIDHYLESVATALHGNRQLPAVLWAQPYMFDRGHEFIPRFLQAGDAATADVTIAAVHLHITMSIGRTQMLQWMKKDGVTVNIVVYDFVRGSGIRGVARALGRSEAVLRALCNDSAEALLWLSEHAPSGKLRIGVLEEDPGIRSYIVDGKRPKSSTSEAFFTRRGPLMRATDHGGDWSIDPNVVAARISEVDALWERPRIKEFSAWRSEYEEWKATPEARLLLGQEFQDPQGKAQRDGTD